MTEKKFKSGFAGIVGRPNVGKSTFMNLAVGQKVAITSPRAQTTRNKIQGIVTADDYQIIFLDTPGIHKPDTKLSDFMVQSAYTALKEVEVILFLVAADEKIGPGDRFIIEKLKDLDTPVILVINKIDTVSKETLAEIIAVYNEEMEFAEIVPISATEGSNVPTLIEQIVEYLPEGPQYYPADAITDHPEYFVVAEFIREQVLHLTREEVPHSVAVKVESMQRRESDNRIHVHATIIVERKTQKGIIIGKGGAMIKEIGTKARRSIEDMVGERVYLELWVKVVKNWKDNQNFLSDHGYADQDYKK